MRMWMVDPALMCDRHLLGEHVETHMLAGTLARRRSIDGYVANGLLEPRSVVDRHDRLGVEMAGRGFRHESPLAPVDIRYLPAAAREHSVDPAEALAELRRRCPACRVRACRRIAHGGPPSDV